MALLDSEIDNIEKELALTPWSHNMDQILDLLQAKRKEAYSLAREPLHQLLVSKFDLDMITAKEFIDNCLEQEGAPGYTLIRNLTTFMEKTPK